MSGVVLNAVTGGPISRVLVRVNDRAMLTDHEGKFEFDQFASSGSATIEVRKPGYYYGMDIGNASTVLRADQMAAPVVLRLYPEALITGTVTAPDGSPLPRVFVSAIRSTYNESGHQWFPLGHGTTNAHGEFRMAVPPGDYRIETNFSPRLAGSADAVLPVSFPAAADGLIHMGSGSQERFELHPVVSRTYPVRLRVDAPQDRGFPSLLAKSADGSLFPVRVLRGEDSGEGEMQIALPSGTFTLIAYLNHGDAMEYGEANVTVADHELAGIVLRLAPVSPIPVQIVVDPDSTSDKTPPTAQQLGITLQNVQGIRVGSYSFYVSSGQNQDASLRPTPGSYRLATRNIGQWFIKSAMYGTTNLQQEDMTVTWGSASAPIVVTVSDQTGGLQGTTQLKGEATSTWIYVIPNAPSTIPFYAGRSSTNGAFSFSSLPPGSYRIVAFEERYSMNYEDRDVLNPYRTYVQNVTITAGEKATANLDVVPAAEMHP